jgi:septum formation protein
VVLDGVVLGKPATTDEALDMLRALSGRTHDVMTAVAVADAGEELVTAAVTFTAATEAALRWYVSTGEPMDKAGGYAVQGIGGFLVERIDGSHSAVVGLPLVETLALLRRAGYILPWERQ